MRYSLFIALLVCFFGAKSQEPHHKYPLSIDELLKKNDPKTFKALTTNSNFLVLANYRNGKRWKYFEGDLIRFKTKNGDYFEENISFIEDSTFTIYKYNSFARQMETFTFYPKEIKSVYKHKRGGVLKTGLLSMAPFIPMALIDWAVYNTPPNKNSNLLWIAPIVGVGNILIFKNKNIFNKQTLRNNKELKIISPI